ncbi:MAG: EAL domain-containing protein [Clostridia bacterium]
MSEATGDADLLAHLWVAWQPVVDLERGVPVGHEALIRGPVGSRWAMPAELFAWADGAGRARELEMACRGLAFEAAQAWWPPGQRLFLNVDGRWTRASELGAHRAGGIPLALEISERHPIVSDPALLSAVARWRQAGHLLVLDDYGTGYAAAATVLAVQPDIVKLDRALISGIDGNRQKRSLVRSLRAWTTDLGIRLVAEGIETEAELAVLQDLGCDYGQGYLLGRPGPDMRAATEISLTVSRQRRVPAPTGAASPLTFYAGAIQDSPIASYIVDHRRRLVAWNAAAAALLEHSAEDLVGELCFRSPLDHRNQAGHRLCVGACPLVHAMAERRMHNGVVSARTRSGVRQVIQVWVLPLVDSRSGRVVGALEQFSPIAGWPDATAAVPGVQDTAPAHAASERMADGPA